MNKYISLQIFNKKIDAKVIVLATIAVILELLRVKLTNSMYLLFLLWNLFLAIIPYAIAIQIKNDSIINKKNRKNLLLLCIWFLFIPNTFYLITDFVHLHHTSTRQFLFDSILLSTFTIAGFHLGISSLNHIHKILRSNYSNKISTSFLIIICYSSAFGIYLGRILRFNSWDVLSNPVQLLHSILNCLFLYDAYVFTMELGTLILILYILIYYKNKKILWK